MHLRVGFAKDERLECYELVCALNGIEDVLLANGNTCISTSRLLLFERRPGILHLVRVVLHTQEGLASDRVDLGHIRVLLKVDPNLFELGDLRIVLCLFERLNERLEMLHCAAVLRCELHAVCFVDLTRSHYAAPPLIMLLQNRPCCVEIGLWRSRAG